MMCDILVASDKAVMGLVEITLGIIPGGGGTVRLTQAVGKSKAMQMILTAERIGAEEALKYGLVSQVFKHEDLIKQTLKMAAKIAGFSREAAAHAKRSVR